VNHEANVGLVDAHAKRDGGNHDVHVVVAKGVLNLGALLRRHPGMVGAGPHALLRQEVRRGLRRLAREAVDDAALPGTSAHQAQDCVAHGGQASTIGAFASFSEGVHVQIRAKERAPKDLRRAHSELLDDVLGDGLGGGGRERQYRHVPETPFEVTKLPICRPKVVPPLADAVCLVHGNQRELQLRQRTPDGRHQTLRRGVNQLEGPFSDLAHTLRALLRIERGIQKSGAHADLAEGVHLVLHQRDERRNDQGNAAQHPRRDLEGERFPRARGHDAYGIAAGEHAVDQLFLPPAETVVAKDVLQHVFRTGRVLGRSRAALSR
jgi:hypothetical protein